MSSFLRFRDCVLNTRYIHHINISSDKYHFHMKGNTNGVILFGSGSLSEDYEPFVVSKEKNVEDYDKVSRWLSKLDN